MLLYTSPAGDAVYLHFYPHFIQESKCLLEQLWACISLFLSMSVPLSITRDCYGASHARSVGACHFFRNSKE